jgi:RHS repeat-associated protein
MMAPAENVDSAARPDPRGRVVVGHPVDVASGHYLSEQSDLIRGGCVALELTRFFSTGFLEVAPAIAAAAASEALEPFGPGWRASWQYELRQSLDGYVFRNPSGVQYSLEDSREPALAFAATGRIVTPRYGLELRRVDASRLRVTRYGLDRDRLSHVFARSPDGHAYRLESIERTAEARVDIHYDAEGRPVELVQHPEGRRLRVSWQDGRVVAATQLGPDGQVRLVASYAFDASGRLATVHDQGGVREQYEYDRSSRIIHERSRRGSLYTVRYDARGRCSYVSGSDHYQERTLRYDVPGRTTRVADSHGAVTTYEYNEEGQVLKETSPLGRTKTFGFDEWGRPESRTDAAGALYVTHYDSQGRIATVSRPDGRTRVYAYDDDHRLICVVFESGYRVDLARDADNNVTGVRLPRGAEWRYRYNAFGQCVAMQNPLGGERSIHYDERGHTAAESDWNGHVTRASYTADGLLASVTDPAENTTYYGYGPHDELIRVRAADGRVWERWLAHDESQVIYTRPDGRQSSVRFSSCGQPLEIVDEDGFVIRYDWDSEPGRLLAITNAAGARYELTYNADGEILGRTTFDGRVFRYEWSGGRLARTHEPDGSEITWHRDVLGRVIKREDRDGAVEYGYDANDELVEINAADTRLAFDYDESGLCTGESQGRFGVRRTFDALGRRLSHATSLGDESRFGYDANGACVTLERSDVHVDFIRDPLGREIRRTLPGAGIFDQTYDPLGRVLSQTYLTESSQYREAPVRRAFAYDAAGLLSRIEDSLRGSAELLHDGRGSLLGVVREAGTSELYAHDAVGNRAASAVTPFGRDVLSRAQESRSTQLWSIAGQFGAVSEQVVTPGAGESLRVVGRDRSIAYTQDLCARVTSKTIRDAAGERTLRFGWDARGQLASATVADGSVWRYRYDGLGRRVAKVAPDGRETTYLWDGFRVSHVVGPDGSVVAWVHAPEGGAPVLRDDGEIRYVLPDAVAAPAELVARDGTMVEAAGKDTWGGRFSGKDIDQPFLGQQYDAETGLHYNVFRYYDPDSARYLSPDPIEPAGGLNAFSWVPDPFQWVDPRGLAGVTCPPSIADDPELHRLWEEAMKKTAEEGKDNGYTRLLGKLERGEQPTGKDLSAGFKSVNDNFLGSAREAGYDIAQVHHWNFPKSAYPDQVFDPRNLVPTGSRAEHESYHDATSGSTSKWSGPIAPENVKDIDGSAYPLAPR